MKRSGKKPTAEGYFDAQQRETVDGAKKSLAAFIDTKLEKDGISISDEAKQLLIDEVIVQTTVASRARQIANHVLEKQETLPSLTDLALLPVHVAYAAQKNRRKEPDFRLRIKGEASRRVDEGYSLS